MFLSLSFFSLSILEDTQLTKLLLTSDVIPHLFALLRHDFGEETQKKRTVESYCLSILSQIAFYSNPSQFNGSYSDPAFASLLIESLFSYKPPLMYGVWLLKGWTSQSHVKPLFSSFTIPDKFLMLLSLSLQSIKNPNQSPYLHLQLLTSLLSVPISIFSQGIIQLTSESKNSITALLHELLQCTQSIDQRAEPKDASSTRTLHLAITKINTLLHLLEDRVGITAIQSNEQDIYQSIIKLESPDNEDGVPGIL